MFIKEVNRLVLLGLIVEENYSEWGAPSFAQPNTRKYCIGFLSEFHNLNRQLKRKPYPMTKIREILLN